MRASISSTLTRTWSACRRILPTRSVATPSSCPICRRPLSVSRYRREDRLEATSRFGIWDRLGDDVLGEPGPEVLAVGVSAERDQRQHGDRIAAFRRSRLQDAPDPTDRRHHEDRGQGPCVRAESVPPGRGGRHSGSGRRSGHDPRGRVFGAFAQRVVDLHPCVRDRAEPPGPVLLETPPQQPLQRGAASPQEAPPSPRRAPGPPRACPGRSRPCTRAGPSAPRKGSTRRTRCPSARPAPGPWLARGSCTRPSPGSAPSLVPTSETVSDEVVGSPSVPAPVRAFARPKSRSFTASFRGDRHMLAGLRSRWTMPFPCAASSASATCPEDR